MDICGCTVAVPGDGHDSVGWHTDDEDMIGGVAPQSWKELLPKGLMFNIFDFYWVRRTMQVI